MNQYCILLLAFFVLITTCYKCGHSQLKRKFIVSQNTKEHPLLRQLSTTQNKKELLSRISNNEYSPIRIKFYTASLMGDEKERTCYSAKQTFKVGLPPSTNIRCTDEIWGDCYGTCTQDQVMSKAKESYFINELLPDVEKSIKNKLNVVPIHGISLQSERCLIDDGVIVPKEFKNPNIITDADVIVFVTARPTAKNTLGWAAACEITAGSHRPVAGQINIDPTKLDPSVYPKSAMIDVVLHELQHLLGFDSSLFKYYAHQPVTTVETLVHNGEYTHISKIITPKAIEAARSHFGCNSIDGVYLENLGGEGTADSHWKQLRFDTELLVGSLDSRLAYALSTITLALFEDTGWYKPNYQNADYLAWGKGLGCSFYKDRCENWNLKTDGYFCDDENGRGHCTHDFHYKGKCDIVEYTENLRYYEHLPQKNKGGSQPLMDYCPMVQAEFNCRDPRNNNEAAELLGENYSATSGCFKSTWKKNKAKSQHDVRCFQFKCIENSGKMTMDVNVGNRWYKCTQSGQVITPSLSGYSGTLTCPNVTLMCEINAKKKPPPIVDFSSATSKWVDFTVMMLCILLTFGHL